MKDRQFHIYLNDEEYGQVLQALIALKNNLIAQGRYAEGKFTYNKMDDLINFCAEHIIKCLTNKRHFLSEDKSFYTIYTNLYSNPPKNSTNL